MSLLLTAGALLLLSGSSLVLWAIVETDGAKRARGTHRDAVPPLTSIDKRLEVPTPVDTAFDARGA